jgi:hypothetical protein
MDLLNEIYYYGWTKINLMINNSIVLILTTLYMGKVKGEEEHANYGFLTDGRSVCDSIMKEIF